MNRRELEIGSNEWGVAGDAHEQRSPDHRERPAPFAQHPVDLLRMASRGRGRPDNGPMNVSGVGFPGRAERDPRAERAHHLGRDDEPDGRERRVPRTTSRWVTPNCLLIGSFACILVGGRLPRGRHRVHDVLHEQSSTGSTTTSWRFRAFRSSRRSSPRCRSAASGPFSTSPIRASSLGAGLPPPSCSSSPDSTRRASSRPSAPGTGPRTSASSSRPRRLRLRLPELCLRRRRRKSRVLLERREPAAQGSGGRRRGRGAPLFHPRRLGTEQLGARPGSQPGAGDPIRGPSLSRKCRTP